MWLWLTAGMSARGLLADLANGFWGFINSL